VRTTGDEPPKDTNTIFEGRRKKQTTAKVAIPSALPYTLQV